MRVSLFGSQQDAVHRKWSRFTAVRTTRSLIVGISHGRLLPPDGLSICYIETYNPNYVDAASTQNKSKSVRTIPLIVIGLK